ncbi:MAG: YdcF family protein [Pseudomonadota bacterium]
MGVIRLLFRIGLRLLVLGGLVFCAVGAAMLWTSAHIQDTYGGSRGISEPVDVAIVLGGGTKPDLILDFPSRQRVRMGAYHLAQGNARNLIMTGGVMRGLGVSAAQKMREFALETGADGSKILLEERARTTFENLRFSFEMMDARGWTSFAIVSDDYHLARARELSRFLGREPSGLGAARSFHYEPIPMRIAITLRETAAWGYNLYKAAAWWGLGLMGYNDEDRARLVI